jgi:hypothetical protein
MKQRGFLPVVGLWLALFAPATQAQTPTREQAELAAVRRTWSDYLSSKNSRYSANAGTPSPLWLESEQRRWPVYDLAGFYLADGATPEILSITRVSRRNGVSDAEYRIVTLFRSADAKTTQPNWWTEMTVTVYAVRVGDEWRLSNALDRNTRDWLRHTVGPITYVHERSYRYNAERARRAVDFVDSVAKAFEVPRLAATTYYLATSSDEVYALMGLESMMKFGSTGGVAQPVNHQLFSGIPAIGEEYRHELAHLLFAPLCCAQTSYFVSEGVATWLGGTAGADFPTAVRSLAGFLAERPSVSLDSLIDGTFKTTQVYPAAGVLVSMAVERRGPSAVKELFRAGRSARELRTALETMLGQTWPTIATEWRSRVLASAR